MDRLKCMRIFVRVASGSSFAAAARELRLSAATVTKHVSALERELGVRLLERTTRRVQLTEAGRFYLERCGETLQALDDTDAAMSQLSRSPTGILRMTAPDDLAGDLGRVIAGFARDYADVVVDLRLTNRNVDLIEQGYDLGIGLLSPSHASYISRRLCVTTVGVYAAPSYLRAHGTPRKPTELVQHRNLIFVEPQPRTEWTFRKGSRRVQVQVPVGLLSNSGAGLLAMAIEGAGLCIGPSFMMATALAAGQVVQVLADYELGSFPLHVRYPSRRFLPAKVRCFLEALYRYFGSDPDADIWLRRVTDASA